MEDERRDGFENEGWGKFIFSTTTGFCKSVKLLFERIQFNKLKFLGSFTNFINVLVNFYLFFLNSAEVLLYHRALLLVTFGS